MAKTRTKKRVYRNPGVILWEGESWLGDKGPIAVIATMKSKNRKTGNMIQTWIIRTDMSPLDAVMSNADTAVCGSCPLRGESGKRRACYVTVGQAPMAVYGAYKQGRYATYDPAKHDHLFRGRKIRFGAYGEPALIPWHIMRHLANLSGSWTGYTHTWANLHPRQAYLLRQILMASCETVADAIQASLRGWRTFRTRINSAEHMPGEITCPASAEAGERVKCEACSLCAGTSRRMSPCIAITVHGGKGVVGNYGRLQSI